LTIPTFAYDPATGLDNTVTFPNPASGTAARAQFMVLFNQLTVHLNAAKAIFDATTDSASGADNVAATAIAGLTGATVQALLEALKVKLDTDVGTLTAADAALTASIAAVVLGQIPDDSLTDAKLSTAAGAILNVVATHTSDTADMKFLAFRGVRYIG